MPATKIKTNQMNITINGLLISRKNNDYAVVKPTGVSYMTPATFYILGETLSELVNRVCSRLQQFRCTINALYRSPDCDGFSDYSCRNGYYVKAVSPAHAKELMAARYPEYAQDGFTAE